MAYIRIDRSETAQICAACGSEFHSERKKKYCTRLCGYEFNLKERRLGTRAETTLKINKAHAEEYKAYIDTGMNQIDISKLKKVSRERIRQIIKKSGLKDYYESRYDLRSPYTNNCEVCGIPIRVSKHGACRTCVNKIYVRVKRGYIIKYENEKEKILYERISAYLNAEKVN